MNTVGCPGGERWGRAGEEERVIRKSAWAVFDPRGVVGAERLTPRIPDLEGVRLGVLDDTKWNANRLLRKTAAGQPGSAHRSCSRVPPRSPDAA